MADWVMGVPRGEDAAALEKAEERAADAIECCVQHGIDRAMNRYNGWKKIGLWFSRDDFLFYEFRDNILAEQQPCGGGDPHEAARARCGRPAAAFRRYPAKPPPRASIRPAGA